MLEVTYPAGTMVAADALVHAGYDSLYVSYWVRFPTTWLAAPN